MKWDRQKREKLQMKRMGVPLQHMPYPMPSIIYDRGKPQETALYYYKELPSTNQTAKEIFFSHRTGDNRQLIVLADRQTAGRGRLGRSFFSEGGLYFTCVFPHGSFSLPPELLTTAAAAAVCRAVTSEGFPAEIKWVNDILVNGKKICGILAEALSEGNSTLGYIVGIGVNIGITDFPDTLADTAASLSGDSRLKSRIFRRIRTNLLRALHESPRDLLHYCSEKSFVIGKSVRYFGALEGFGIACGLDAHGGLIVKKGNGETVILTGGEISVRTVSI